MERCWDREDEGILVGDGVGLGRAQVGALGFDGVDDLAEHLLVGRQFCPADRFGDQARDAEDELRFGEFFAVN